MNYKFTQEQKDWINKAYPYMVKHYRDQILPMYFKTHYTAKERLFLMELRLQFLTMDLSKLTPEIPLKEYLGPVVVWK